VTPPARRSSLDRFFGGHAGAAGQALKKMQETYGPADGRRVFDGTIAKRKRRERRKGR
jgi:hypothetical protein